MALQGALSAELSAVGAAFPAAYARILHARAEKDITWIYVNTYADEAARQEEKLPVKQWEYQAPTNAVPLVAPALTAAYDWLKTLPEFAGWVDV